MEPHGWSGLNHRAAAIAALVLALVVGCTSLADVDVTYRDCFPVNGIHYAETFDISRQELLDGCWKMEAVAAQTEIFTQDGDLIVRPLRGLRWSEGSQGPIVFRPMRGDFLVVARAEAASTFTGGHCFRNAEAAGLVARRSQPFAWATLLVSPHFDPLTPFEEACVDEPVHPPTARVQGRTYGFAGADAGAESPPKDGVGADGEAYIALCRQGDQLGYYYRVQDPKPGAKAWFQVRDPHLVSTGSLDVGVTATGDSFETASGMEGHFTFVSFFDYSGAPVADGCEGALDAFVAPERE